MGRQTVRQRALLLRRTNLSEIEIVPRDERVRPSPVLRAGVTSSLSEGGMMLQEEGTFGSLLNSIKDLFFPVKLPPLVLESKPIPVIDRMVTRQDLKGDCGLGPRFRCPADFVHTLDGAALISH